VNRGFRVSVVSRPVPISLGSVGHRLLKTSILNFVQITQVNLETSGINEHEFGTGIDLKDHVAIKASHFVKGFPKYF